MLQKKKQTRLSEKAYSELRARWLRLEFAFPPAELPSPIPEDLTSALPSAPFTIPNALHLGPNAPAVRRSPIGRCIYCGAAEFDPGSGCKLSDEHIIPEGLGARLILPEASCKQCALRTQRFENAILGTLLWAPRRKLKIRGKRRTRNEKDYPVTAIVEGKEVTIRLTLEQHPTLLWLPVLNAPGLVCERPIGEHGVQGMWALELNDLNQMIARGTPRFTSPVLDTVQFCQLLAKIAHGYAVISFGLDRFKPVLTNFILRSF